MAVALLLATACAHREESPLPLATEDRLGVAPWSSVLLPGKRATRYQHVQEDGRSVILAQSQSSASMYRQRISVAADQLGTLAFSWRVPALMPQADLSDRDSADSPARIVLAFDGDHRRLSAKNRTLFELAETLTGEAPPYATLMYVWDGHSALESVLPGGRTDRVRKIVVDSGPRQLNAWRRHHRDIARDFERAFGEPPGRLIGVALMTDSDNTSSAAQAAYGELTLTRRDGQVSRLNE